MENVTVRRCNVLNPSTLLSICSEFENEGDDHDCLEVTELCTKPRPDLKDTSLKEPDNVLYVDVSCLRDEGGVVRAAYVNPWRMSTSKQDSD